MAKIEIFGNVGAALKVHEKEGFEPFGTLRVCENEIRDGGEVVEVWYSVFVQDKLLQFLQGRERELKGARVFVRGRFRTSMDPSPSGFTLNLRVTATELDIINYRKEDGTAAEPAAAADPQAATADQAAGDPQAGTIDQAGGDPQAATGDQAAALEERQVAAADQLVTADEGRPSPLPSPGDPDWEALSDGQKRMRLANINDQVRAEKERKKLEAAERKRQKAAAREEEEPGL